MKIICIEKQWGGTNKKKKGRLLDGKEYNDRHSNHFKNMEPCRRVT